MLFFNGLQFHLLGTFMVVSILVLMDVVLQQMSYLRKLKRSESFNPCFNGCCSSTLCWSRTRSSIAGFNPCFNGCCSSTLLYIALPKIFDSFNPCFNGCCSSTLLLELHLLCTLVSILVLMDVVLQLASQYGVNLHAGRFNPCFNGCCSSTSSKPAGALWLSTVSILVLMDVVLQLIFLHTRYKSDCVSILVLMDVVLQPCTSVPLVNPEVVSILVLMDVVLQPT